MTDQSMDDSVNTEAVNDEPVRGEEVAPEQSGATPAAGAADVSGVAGAYAADAVPPGEPAEAPVGSSTDGGHPDTVLAAERLADLQRVQAEYVNYKRRVDRDKHVDRERGIRSVLESLLPTLDDVHAAREHGDLTGPFAAIAEKLEGSLQRGFGLERFGAKGEAFDPAQHEALMHAPWPADDADLPADATTTTVVTVLQPGYRAGEQVLRPARVAVADPE